MVALVGSVGLRDNGTLKIVPAVLLPEINVTATDATATEAGTTTGQFTITSSAAAGASGIAISFSLSGTATITTDYTIDTSPATITQGNTSTIVTVTPVDDATVEVDETVILTLGASVDYLIGANVSDTVTIVSDDAPTTSTFDPAHGGLPLSNNDLTAGPTGNSNLNAISTIGHTTGKRQFTLTQIGLANTGSTYFGIAPDTISSSVALGTTLTSYAYRSGASDSDFRTNGTVQSYGTQINTNDIVDIFVDFDANTIEFELNGVSQGVAPTTLVAATEYFSAASAITGANAVTIDLSSATAVNGLRAGYLAWDT
jgi:hypothetical protein